MCLILHGCLLTGVKTFNEIRCGAARCHLLMNFDYFNVFRVNEKRKTYLSETDFLFVGICVALTNNLYQCGSFSRANSTDHFHRHNPSHGNDEM